MKRDDLNKLIGRKVCITFFDGSCHIGVLGYAADCNEKNMYMPAKHFYIHENYFKSLAFRCSHVKKAEPV